jgi:hypothetical protein
VNLQKFTLKIHFKEAEMPKIFKVTIFIIAILTTLACSLFSVTELNGLPVMFVKGEVKFFSNGELTVEVTYLGEGEEPWLCGDYAEWSSCQAFMDESIPDWENPGNLYISPQWQEVGEMPEPGPPLETDDA